MLLDYETKGTVGRFNSAGRLRRLTEAALGTVLVKVAGISG
jgi:hypothetical protein